MGFDQSYDEMKKRRTMGIIMALAIIVLFTVFTRIRGGSSVPLQPVDDGIILSGKNGEAQTFIRYDNIREMELRTEFEPGSLVGEEGSMGSNYHYGLYENAEKIIYCLSGFIRDGIPACGLQLRKRNRYGGSLQGVPGGVAEIHGAVSRDRQEQPGRQEKRQRPSGALHVL